MALVLAVAFGVASVAAAPANAACALYTTCVDCTCNQLDYDVSQACVSGCAWLPDSGTCVSNSSVAAQQAGVKFTSLWTVPGMEETFKDSNVKDESARAQRERMVENGQTTCDVPRADGVVATVVCFMLAAALFQVAIAYGVMRNRRRLRNTENDLRLWMLGNLHSHIQEGDAVVWEGCAQRPTGDTITCGSHIGFSLLSLLPLTVPSVVWLGIGLPYSVWWTWEFGFFYPICFVGGMGFLGSIALVAGIFGSNHKSMTKAYAVTNRHVLIVTADAAKRSLEGTGAGVKSVAMDAIASCERAGNSVTFEVLQGAGSKSNKMGVRFENLPTDSAGQLFAILQRLRPTNTTAVATAVDGEDVPTTSTLNNSKHELAVEMTASSQPSSASSPVVAYNGAGTGRTQGGYSMVV